MKNPKTPTKAAAGSSFNNPKADIRPKKGAWAPGGYTCVCRKCNTHFIGDKRAGHCADCAYAEAAPQISHADHFRLRLPSEKPTIDDADTDKCVVVYFKDGNSELVADRRYDDCPWGHEAVCWIPGRLPTSLIPKAPTPEELNRQAFEAWYDKEAFLMTETEKAYAWASWQAATNLRSA